MTDHNQRPIAIRLLFVAVAVVCFGQAYRIAAAVGGRAEAASVAQTSTVSAPSLPRYVEKPIEEIRAGDLVLARDDVTGELASKRVVRTFQRTSDHIRELTIRSSLGGLQTIETTNEHPFWVADSGWVSAAQLSPALLDRNGGTSTLVANTHIPRSDGVPVYNFEVDDWHTYHVKAGHATGPPLLVHNNCVNPYHARAPGGGVFVDLDSTLAGQGGAPTRNVARYGGAQQRQALLNQVSASGTLSEAKGVVHSFREMKRVGYELQDVSLHYRGNQGLDLIFHNGSRYAVVEAKHGKYLSLLKTYKGGLRQGSLDYNISRLERYIQYGDGTHNTLTNQLLNEAYSGQLESFGTFYRNGRVLELPIGWPNVPAVPR